VLINRVPNCYTGSFPNRPIHRAYAESSLCSPRLQIRHPGSLWSHASRNSRTASSALNSTTTTTVVFPGVVKYRIVSTNGLTKPGWYTQSTTSRRSIPSNENAFARSVGGADWSVVQSRSWMAMFDVGVLGTFMEMFFLISGTSSGMSVTVYRRTSGENRMERRPIPDLSRSPHRFASERTPTTLTQVPKCVPERGHPCQTVDYSVNCGVPGGSVLQKRCYGPFSLGRTRRTKTKLPDAP